MNKHPQSFSSGLSLLELLVVIALVALLVSLIFGMIHSSFRIAARARTRGEVAALVAALESYKNDYGDYPENKNSSDTRCLINSLMPPAHCYSRVYFHFPSKMINAQGIIDPFGRNYHYLYKASADKKGFFELWSTGENPQQSRLWIKN